MKAAFTLTQKQLSQFLIGAALKRPVFIWGAPGIGKSALVEQFAASVGIPCVSLLGSQLAPEDIAGVPQIQGEVSRFFPPAMIARKEPYCLFLDELNACKTEVQKSMYSLIHEHRVGEYQMPKGSIVIAAGNREQDSAIVKPMSSALINRMIHVTLTVSANDWLEWAHVSEIHPTVTEYIGMRPMQLWSLPPKSQEPFSTPRSWHMLSDALHEFGDKITSDFLLMLAFGCLSPEHAGQFVAYQKVKKNKYHLDAILKGEAQWPKGAEDRDVLYFLCGVFRDRLVKELPEDKEKLDGRQKDMVHRSKAMMRELSAINEECAQVVVSKHEGRSLPAWYLTEIVRDLPRLAARLDGNS